MKINFFKIICFLCILKDNLTQNDINNCLYSSKNKDLHEANNVYLLLQEIKNKCFDQIRRASLTSKKRKKKKNKKKK